MPTDPTAVTLPSLVDQASDLWSELRITEKVARELALSHARGDLDNDDYLTAVANLGAAVKERTAPLLAGIIASVEAYAADTGLDEAIEESIRSDNGALIEGAKTRLDDAVGGAILS